MATFADDISTFTNDSLDDADTAASRTMRGAFADAGAVRRFIQANKLATGSAVFTLESGKTGKRFTYRVRQAIENEQPQDMFFVAVLTGADNNTDYKYIGYIRRSVFWAGRKTPKPGDINTDAPSVKAFDWTWRQIVRGELPEQLHVYHEGRCGRCSRRLTVPESITSGFGPECIGKL